MRLKAYCKINIGLHVVRKREDGYHELETVMLGVKGLYDTVDVEPIDGNDIIFTSHGIVVDCPAEKNLCVRAARLMQQRYNIGGVAITLDKRVPFGAGLGGGSSDATAVIVAINDIFNLGISKPDLASLAAELGSDTPFFVYDTPQLCTGRGEIMEPININLRGYWLAVAKPINEGVSTAEAYSGIVPKMPARGLRELLAGDITTWQQSVANDFEPHIFAAHPAIATLKQSMLEAGATYAAMSGSGAAVFGIFKHMPRLHLPNDTFVHIEQM